MGLRLWPESLYVSYPLGIMTHGSYTAQGKPLLKWFGPFPLPFHPSPLVAEHH